VGGSGGELPSPRPTTGTINTGSGGGGESHAYADDLSEHAFEPGAAGGSGTVIVRYTRAQVGG
jgi:hypothetical protein